MWFNRSKRSPSSLAARFLRWSTLALPVALSACTLIYHHPVEVAPLSPAQAPQELTGPVKAYMTDGTVAFFKGGATLRGDTLFGAGVKYGLTLAPLELVGSIAVSNTVGVQTYSGGHLDRQKTILVNAAAIVGSAGLMIGLFALAWEPQLAIPFPGS